MIDLFLQVGVLTMSLLTFLLISVVIAFSKKHELVKSLGILAFIIGLLSAILGLYSAFKVIEQVGNVAPSILAGGIKTAFASLIYGLIIFVISLVLDIVTKLKR
tara:strand:- start:65 stop:376 length:312 start_codon:yes stop_codon:yes gene_type:complete